MQLVIGQRQSLRLTHAHKLPNPALTSGVAETTLAELLDGMLTDPASAEKFFSRREPVHSTARVMWPLFAEVTGRGNGGGGTIVDAPTNGLAEALGMELTDDSVYATMIPRNNSPPVVYRKTFSKPDLVGLDDYKLTKSIAKQVAQNLDWLHTSRGKIIQYISGQHSFLRSGKPSDLKPLTQNDVALDFGYDASTISRLLKPMTIEVVHIDAPTRMYHATSLFIPSKKVLRYQLCDFLNFALRSESKNTVYSDDYLSQIAYRRFHKIGESNPHSIKDLAPPRRRTITKWREDADIPSRHVRLRGYKQGTYSPILFPNTVPDKQ